MGNQEMGEEDGIESRDEEEMIQNPNINIIPQRKSSFSQETEQFF